MIDIELEKQIDRAGRDKVFAIMRQNGWYGNDAPPKIAWHMAIEKALQEKNR